jgi:phosphoribosylanthranilate isomerase
MNVPVQVKICGITNPADAHAAIDAGADALGFNLFPGSRRYVPLAELKQWLPSLTGALRVAVMVDPTIEEIRAAQPWFDVIQLHGHETPALCADAASEGPIWKAFPLTAALVDASLASYKAKAILIDTPVPGSFGGTGILIDLDRAAAFVRSQPNLKIWLSGGLSPDNVFAAVHKVRPYGVDVASGVELRGPDPRRKDPARIRAFIAAAKQAPIPA